MRTLTILAASIGIFGMSVVVLSYGFLCFGALYIEVCQKRFPARTNEFKGAMMFTRGLGIYMLIPLMTSFVVIDSWGARLSPFDIRVILPLITYAAGAFLMFVWGKSLLVQVHDARTEPAPRHVNS